MNQKTSIKKTAKITEPDKDGDLQGGERIAKRMARAGLCSRRDAERWIEAGRVVVNGKLLKTPACVVTDQDKIEVDGNALPQAERTRLWLLNKKSGTVTTSSDPEGRTTVFDVLPDTLPRVLTIGRLDINTEGLLLLTNDGGLSRALELPSTGWLRRYRVRAHGSVTQEQLDALKDGIAVDGVLYGAIEAEIERVQGTNVWITFAMREGKNREVKNVLGALGLEVNRLIRISYGPFQLGDLTPGEVREVRGRTLRDQLGQKLIDKAGANFDTPETVAKAPARTASVKVGRTPRKKPDKLDPLARLDTKPNRPGPSGKPGGKGGSKGKDKPKAKGGRGTAPANADGNRGTRSADRTKSGPGGHADRRR